jgi:putative membrane protein
VTPRLSQAGLDEGRALLDAQAARARAARKRQTSEHWLDQVRAVVVEPAGSAEPAGSGSSLRTAEPAGGDPLRTAEPASAEPLRTAEPASAEPLRTAEPASAEPLRTDEPNRQDDRQHG